MKREARKVSEWAFVVIAYLAAAVVAMAVESPAPPPTKAHAHELQQSGGTAVQFAAGQHELSPEARAAIGALVKGFASGPDGVDAVIVGWSDRSFDPDSDADFSPKDARLADRRLAAVKAEVVATARLGRVQLVNMAELSNPFALFFGTRDAKLKDAYRHATSHDEFVLAEAQALRDKGGAGRVVVLLRAQSASTATL